MLKGTALKYGDTIGIIAPSSSTPIEKIEKMKTMIENMGFKVKIGLSCYKKYGYLSGSDEIRASDINNMFSDKNVDAIFCMRGGYGALRTLDKINFDLIKQNPKIFVGYSDITTLHIAFNKLCNMVTFHGPMVSSDMINFDEFSKQSLFDSIMCTSRIGELTNPDGTDIKCLVPGIASGEIIGGNLSLVVASLGTPYEIDTNGKILFLEDICEEPYSIDRMLMHLKFSGKLNDANGIILGDFNNCVAEKPEDSLSLENVFNDIIKPLNKPTLFDLKSGHCSPKVTIPFGLKTTIDCNNCKIFIEESAVRFVKINSKSVLFQKTSI